jgi:hypothetical protein
MPAGLSHRDRSLKAAMITDIFNRKPPGIAFNNPRRFTRSVTKSLHLINASEKVRDFFRSHRG